MTASGACSIAPGMAKRSLMNVSWDDSFDYLISVSQSLQVLADDGDKEIKALQPPVTKLLTRWDELDLERRERRVAVLLGNTLVRRRDQGGDGTVQALHNDALSAANLDRTVAFFQRLFPTPVSLLIQLSLPGELPEWKELQRRLAEPEMPAALRKAHEGPLKTAIEQGTAALAQREAAYTAQGLTAARIQGFREDCDRVLQGLYGALTQLQAARKLPKAWLDSFFPEPPKAPKKKAAPLGPGF